MHEKAITQFLDGLNSLQESVFLSAEDPGESAMIAEVISAAFIDASAFLAAGYDMPEKEFIAACRKVFRRNAAEMTEAEFAEGAMLQ